jgi:alpha-glucosidase
MNAFLSFEHRHDMDQDDNPEIFRRWNSIAAEYDALLLGEIALDDFDRVRRYTDGDALHRVFALRTTWIGWNPDYVAQSVRDLVATVGSGVAWAFSCHDQPRPVTRFGGGERGADRALLLTTLSLALDGMPFLYQGQELGIGDGEPLTGIRQDPIAVRNDGAAGRDGCRTPMPWSDGPQNGFTTATLPWLPARLRPLAETVEGQRSQADSWLERHRELLAHWRQMRGSADEPAELLPTDDDLLIVARRGRIMAVANLSEREAEVPLPEADWSVVFSSRVGTPDGVVDGAVVVPAECALLLRG